MSIHEIINKTEDLLRTSEKFWNQFPNIATDIFRRGIISPCNITRRPCPSVVRPVGSMVDLPEQAIGQVPVPSLFSH